MEYPSAPSQASPEITRSAAASLSDSDNGSSVSSGEGTAPPPVSSPEAAALRRLSANLESLLFSSDLSVCADSRICVGSRVVPVHRCLLSARSPFFLALFSRDEEKKRTKSCKLELQDLVPGIKLGHQALMKVLEYMYTGRLGPLPEGICDCVDELCLHVACRPAVDFLVQVLCISSTFQISELVSLYQRHLLDILEKVDDEDLLVILSAAGNCGMACERLESKCVELVAVSDLDVVAMEKSLTEEIVKKVLEIRLNQEPTLTEKHARKIQKALDSDDVELVRMLLMEGNITLDDACALHYAVAYCDAKITVELLEIGVADVNKRNERGQTVLHVAARRKEPNIIVSLLTKGASTGDLTRDGRNALQIAKRLTRYGDYYRETEQGMATPKDKLCIEILEQAEGRAPLPGEASVTLAIAGEDARTRLLYLENRVALARLLFPMEAKVAMDIAQVDGTLEFTLGTGNLGGNKSSQVDLNETPFNIKKEHVSRIQALSKTVELGKRFFPRCSKVLDKIMDDEGANNGTAWTATTEEQFRRKRTYQELQEIVCKAFSEDKQENDRSALCSSSSSPMTLEGIRQKLNRNK